MRQMQQRKKEAGAPKAAAVQGFGGPSVFAVDPGAIRPCLFRYTYIWRY